MIVTHVPIIIIIGAHAFFCDIKVISTYLLSLVLHLVATYFYDGPDSNNIISKNVGYKLWPQLLQSNKALFFK